MSATCHSCGAGIVWVEMQDSHKPMPIDTDSIVKRVVMNAEQTKGAMRYTGTSHFATCPHAKSHRKADG